MTEEKKQSTTSENQSSGRTILLIEDNKFLLKLYQDKLQREGFNVLASLTAEEGLNKIYSKNPDLIILDIVLPGKNGFEVLEELKQDPRTQNIPVIILSNLEQESDIKRGLKLGACDYLIKTDFSVNKLAKKIRKNLEKSKK